MDAAPFFVELAKPFTRLRDFCTSLGFKYLASPITATVALLTVLGWWMGVRLRVRLRVRVAIHLKD